MKEKKRMQEISGRTVVSWLFYVIPAVISGVILCGTDFLRVPVLGSEGIFGLISWSAALSVIYVYGFSGRREIGKRRIVCSSFCGLLMALMILLGIRYSLNEVITISTGRSIIAYGALTLVFAGSISGLYRFLAAVRAGASEGCVSSREPSDASVSSEVQAEEKTSFVRTMVLPWTFWFLLTMIVYLPVFLAVYPGVYSYDASIQVMQLYGHQPLTTHHPLLHSLYLLVCFKTGELLFHSTQAGMAMYALSQAVFMAAVFSLLLCRMKKRGTSLWLRIVFWAFLVLNPYLTIFSFVTTKDVIYGAFFLLFFDLSVELAQKEEEFFNKKLFVLMYAAVGLFMCLFRNQGIYVYWFYGFFYLGSLFIRKKKLKVSRDSFKKTASGFLSVLLLVSICWYGLSSPLPALMGIGKGDAREMFSVPMQQLARVWTVEPESLTEEEEAYIETLIAPSALEAYVRVNADPVKSGFCTPILKEDPGKFLSVWISAGLKNPDHYFDSFCMGNWGYWYPGESQYWINYILFDGAFMEPEHNILNIRRNTKFPALEQTLREISLTPVFDEIPVLSFLLNQAFPFWLMLTAAFWLIWRKQYRLLIPLSLILGYWGTLLLGPVTSVRYVLPILYCVPGMAELFRLSCSD